MLSRDQPPERAKLAEEASRNPRVMYAQGTAQGIIEMENRSQGESVQSAMQPSIVEYFSIDGLYGYRSVGLSSKYAATVLIARNGSGKTTLIAALDAFLRGQFSRFIGLTFEKITCRLRGQLFEFEVYRSDIEQLSDFALRGEFAVRAKAWDVQPMALLALVEGPIRTLGYSELVDDPTFSAIYAKMGYDYAVAKSQCERLSKDLSEQNLRINQIRNQLASTLKDFEIVYLPTYRRIELSLPGPDVRRGERKKSVLSRLGVTRTGLYSADIQFGLGDISDRLAAIYSEMLYTSNQGYGKVSANIINDLISGKYRDSANSATTEFPSRESLDIFFSRIKDASREYRRGPYSFFAPPNLDPIYNGDIPEDSAPFLTYFLNQLNSVILETRGYEERVQAFISNCNKYLSGNDESTDEYTSPLENTFDSKKLDFDRRALEVTVKSLATGDDVPLESLSSGEKQMMSLFARLYLYPGPKIVLIDEPELSLSLDWQRQILPDVLRAPTCKQVIAITHSPFIFNNELEPFAGSLRFRITPTRKHDTNDGDLNLDDDEV
ncbi:MULTISPECIES: AAA family ATPase [Burkholderia]|uniref:AAA family ATPase n=1 Tax=Burkholderia TaxID=32008 RepID=UPI0009E51DD5|nr:MULTISPECIES: AAA family ATPase [Burkholderia]